MADRTIRCWTCGAPRKIDEEILEIQFHCRRCGQKLIWRKQGLHIHYLEDDETREWCLVILIPIGVLALFLMCLKDLEENNHSWHGAIPMTVGICVMIYLYFFFLSRCHRCGKYRALKVVELARFPGFIRHTRRCKYCDHQVVTTSD